MFKVTVITSSDIELSVILLKDDALDGCLKRRRLRRLRYAGAWCCRETLVMSVDVETLKRMVNTSNLVSQFDMCNTNDDIF